MKPNILAGYAFALVAFGGAAIGYMARDANPPEQSFECTFQKSYVKDGEAGRFGGGVTFEGECTLEQLMEHFPQLRMPKGSPSTEGFYQPGGWMQYARKNHV